MPTKLSFDVCKTKVDYLSKELKDLKWTLSRINNKDKIIYVLSLNGGVRATGTLKEIDNYIEGLIMGYGVNIPAIYNVGQDANKWNSLNKTEKQNKSITATLDFTVKREPINRELAKQMDYCSRLDYHCAIKYLPAPEEDFYMKITIDRYYLDTSKRSTVLTIPKKWLNVNGLDYLSNVEEKARDILESIDSYFAEEAISKIDKGDTESGLNYLRTITKIQSVYYNYILENLVKTFGKKITGLYTDHFQIINIKSTNFEQITYNK